MNYDDKTILVADDEAQILQLIADLLKEHGFIIKTATDGAEALAIVEQGGIDAILTDIKMPVMSGIQLVTHVRQRYPHIKCAYVSGYGSLAAEANDRTPILAKPWSFNELLRFADNIFYNPNA